MVTKDIMYIKYDDKTIIIFTLNC